MADDVSYDRLLRESLKEELRFLNAQLPGKQKSLGELLGEDSPSITCADGSLHLFKRKELEYLSGLIENKQWNLLLLPVIIEINPGEDVISVVCQGNVEEAIISAILGMPVQTRHHRIVIYKPQLATIRKVLKTTTQYMFSPKILQ